MRSIVVLLAASLVGAGRSDGPGVSEITYQWKFLEMDGLGWRSALHRQLQPVARQESATVWTASRETASKLADSAAKVVGSPRVTASPGGLCTVRHNTTMHFVGEMSREADGPVNHASFVGFVPRVHGEIEGYSAEVTGRKLDQGVLAKLTLVDRRVTACHGFPVGEDLEPRPGQGHDAKPTHLQCTIQVPEVARTSVSGEWLVPKDGVLVVSLGVHTVADRHGKAVAREYLAVLEADEAEAQPASVAAALLMMPDLHAMPLAAAGQPVEHPIPMPMASPTLPSRSLPRPFDPAGKPVEMPPLPDEKTVTTIPGSSEPCASPQAKTAKATGEPLPWKSSRLRDPQANLTGFQEESKSPADKAKEPEYVSDYMKRLNAAVTKDKALPCCDAAAYCDGDEPDACKRKTPDASNPTRFSIPLNADFKIEIDVKVTPKSFDREIGSRY